VLGPLYPGKRTTLLGDRLFRIDKFNYEFVLKRLLAITLNFRARQFWFLFDLDREPKMRINRAA
jgi:hypothetical protein